MPNESDDLALDAARTRLSVIASGLALRFGDDVAAATLLGAAAGVLLDARSDADVSAYLREMADELDSDEAPRAPVGHA